ncbi:MAG: hypothetical protein HY291_22860 [Planctomycetes bacterium]|nr:hypothetical protein [Planctomycetota bacterium]
MKRALGTALLLATILARAEDAPPLPPAEVWPAPKLIVKDATGGLLDANGKLWAWRLKKDAGDGKDAWAEPDRESIEKAYASKEPLLMTGAKLLLVHGEHTVWLAREGKSLCFSNGNKWFERVPGRNTGVFDGSAADIDKSLLVFGTPGGVLSSAGIGWQWIELIPEAVRERKAAQPLHFVQDQAGTWYAYYPELGSIWKLACLRVRGAPPEDVCTYTLVAREIPVLDSLEGHGVGEVARHPDGTKENPILLAGGVLLEKGALRPPEPPAEKELKDLAAALASDKFEERDRAAKVFLEDGKDGAWRYSRLLLDADPSKNADPEYRSQILKAVLDRVARFEPGRSRDYARQLQKLGVLDEAFVKEKGGDYKNLWIALEEKGHWNRETRVGFERDRREARLEWQNLWDRVHNRHVLTFPINGEWNFDYACEELHQEVDGNSWNDARRGYWEDRERKALYLAMGRGGVWRITNNAEKARGIAFNDPANPDAAPKARCHLDAEAILGRDAQQRLLVVGTVKTVRFDEAKKDWAEEQTTAGIWALEEPKSEKP